MLFGFVHDVEVGDVVVSTHDGDRAVYVGRVAGDYRYVERTPVPGFRHLRPVHWLTVLDRDREVETDRRKQIDRPPTFYPLPDTDFWLGRIERTGADRPRPPSRTPRPGTTDGTVERRAEVATAVCDACFQRKSAVLMEGGVCADCRA